MADLTDVELKRAGHAETRTALVPIRSPHIDILIGTSRFEFVIASKLPVIKMWSNNLKPCSGIGGAIACPPGARVEKEAVATD